MIHFDEAGRGLPWTEVLHSPDRIGDWVQHVWIMRFPPSLSATDAWKIVPDLSPHLLVHDAPSWRRIRLVGPRSRATEVPVGERRWTVGVRLRPGTLPHLTGSPAHEFLNRSSPLGAIWGATGDILESQIREASGPTVVAGLITKFLAGRANELHRMDWRARTLMASDPTHGHLHIGDLTKRVGISRRSLQAAARTTLGVTPTQVVGIKRLFVALEAGLANPDPNWSRVAARSGYHDGPHLTRHFTRIMGEPPSVWRARACADPYNR